MLLGSLPHVVRFDPSTRVLRSLMAMVALGLTACTSEASPDPQQTASAEGGSTTSDGDTQAQSLYFVLNRIRSPDGRTMFASMLPELDVGSVDVAGALELTGVSRARVYADELYAFDGESGMVSRYRIENDGSLSVDTLDGSNEPAQVSFAGLGVTLFWSTIVFVDDETAFYMDLGQDLVVQWNPTQMTITNSFEAGVARDGFDVSSGQISRIDRYVVVPLSWSNQASATAIETNAIGILDLEDPSALRILEDERCVGTSDTFEHDGAVYVLGDNFSGLAAALTDTALPPPCLLRWVPGAETFDPEYQLDVTQRAGFPLVAGAIARGDGTFMTQAYTSAADPSTLGVFELLDGDHWQRVIVSLEDDEATIVEDVPAGPLSARGWIVEDAYTFPQTRGSEAVLFRLEGSAANEQLTIPGELFFVERVR